MKDDLDRIIEKRKKIDPEFENGFDAGYQAFKIGMMLKLAREKAGMTQEQVAIKLRTNKSAISRLENHAEDIRLSTLSNYARAIGKKMKVEIG